MAEQVTIPEGVEIPEDLRIEYQNAKALANTSSAGVLHPVGRLAVKLIERIARAEADNKTLRERLEEQRAVNLRLIEDVKSMTGKIGSGREQMERLSKPEDLL